jgi:hypothetical protein
MNIAIEQPANDIVIELEDRPAVANEFARLAWSDLCGWLREASEGLRGGQSHDGFEIGDWDSLVWPLRAGARVAVPPPQLRPCFLAHDDLRFRPFPSPLQRGR